MKKSHKITILATTAIALLIIGFTTFKLYRTDLTNMVSAVKSSGTALVGGPFSLINHDGKTVTEKDFAGKYMLIYFGYTFCPDVCPTELQVITSALEEMGDKAKIIQPVFVSVDPERDTPAVMKDYVSNFYPGMVGLTGNADQISKIAKSYRVYYSKAAEAGADAKDYAMDHSSIIYLMGPKGSFVKHFPYGTDPKKLAKELTLATKG